MEVSPNALRKETVQLLRQIQEQLDGLDDARQSLAEDRLAPLLLAKAQCLNTLTLLGTQDKRR